MTKEELELKLLDRPHSPLFARLADEYLAASRVDDAKKVCTEGLKKFPRYGTAHLILSKCHFVENNFALALASVENAQACIPDPDLLEGLCEELLAVISKGGGPEPTYDRTESLEGPEISMESLAAEPPVETAPQEVHDSQAASTIEIPPESSEEIQGEIPPVVAEEGPAAPTVATDQQPSVASELPEETEPSETPSENPPQSSAVVDEAVEEPVGNETVTEDVQEIAPESADIQLSAEPPSIAVPVSEEVVEVASVQEPTPADQLPLVEEQTEVSEPAEPPVSTAPVEEVPKKPGSVDRTTEAAEYQPTETDRIITRTLAEIYASQKAYDEAIVTYRLLKEQKPECMEEIDARIAELRRLQQEKSRE